MSGGQLVTVTRRFDWRPTSSIWRLPICAFLVAFAIVLVMVIDPYSGAYADATAAPNHWVVIAGQTYVAQDTATVKVTRDAYGVTDAAVAPVGADASAPSAGAPTPGSAKATALGILQSKGMGNDQYDCLVSLWNRESHWSVTAANPDGAYGIPQALPGNKMASVGADWRTSAKTQILWGLGYISGRYGTPCGAWAHSQATGWY